MSLKDDMKAARKAVDKLQTYCDELPRNSEPTKKYYELNSAADKAIKKLPAGLRSQLVLDFSRLIIR